MTSHGQTDLDLVVAVGDGDVAPWIEAFSSLLPERRIVTEATCTDFRAVRYAATWKHPPGSLGKYPNLAALFSLGAGVDHLLDDPTLPAVPIVRSVSTDLTARMSEWVVLQCLMHLRQTLHYARQQAQAEWHDDASQPAANEVRVGIMGLGRLGSDAALKLAMLGFDVAGWSSTRKELRSIASYVGPEEVDRFLARTDILVCLLPLTPATAGMLNLGLFSRLARNGRLGGPILINAGRGRTQVEADIIVALDTGILKAASLDVFETEPLPAASPLWRHPDVLVTPHNAAMSEPGAIASGIASQIKAYEAGRPLENVAEIARGY